MAHLLGLTGSCVHQVTKPQQAPRMPGRCGRYDLGTPSSRNERKKSFFFINDLTSGH